MLPREESGSSRHELAIGFEPVISGARLFVAKDFPRAIDADHVRKDGAQRAGSEQRVKTSSYARLRNSFLQ